jgi:hypothetical protein
MSWSWKVARVALDVDAAPAGWCLLQIKVLLSASTSRVGHGQQAAGVSRVVLEKVVETIIFNEAFPAAHPTPPCSQMTLAVPQSRLRSTVRRSFHTPSAGAVKTTGSGAAVATKQRGNLKGAALGAAPAPQSQSRALQWLNGGFGAEGVQNVSGSGGGSGGGGNSSWGPSRGRSGYAGASGSGSREHYYDKR